VSSQVRVLVSPVPEVLLDPVEEDPMPTIVDALDERRLLADAP
jgi:hypothetical protein